jgi:hypothetical protein
LREDEAQRTLGPSRVGVVQEFDPHASGDSGLWTELADGGWLWTMAFHAPDAAAVRIRVRPWNPPVGAELIVYDGYDPAFRSGPLGLGTSGSQMSSGPRPSTATRYAWNTIFRPDSITWRPSRR